MAPGHGRARDWRLREGGEEGRSVRGMGNMGKTNVEIERRRGGGRVCEE